MPAAATPGVAHSDKINNQIQYFYGVQDMDPPPPTAYTPADLVTLEAKFIAVDVDGETQYLRVVEGTNTSAVSWKMELYNGQSDFNGPSILGSERVVAEPLVVGGVVFFTTFVPDQDVCDGGGDTWVFALDYKTGMAPIAAIFDINGDGVYDDNDLIDYSKDGIDNDGDGQVDEEGETSPDGIDNDGDGLVDEDGEKGVPIGIKVGRGLGSLPVLHKQYLFITTSGDGTDTDMGLITKKINLPTNQVIMEAWRQD